ncbi:MULTISPECIES: pyridoxamine 5'-phosphate oxidase family protein [Rhodomicrobium]|uniref:pyridoxamine 5'-phosphate oxidase family protein n=1 Tax=Rhodomicrobium TaxID=1068 RepID=UPI000B4B7C2E|nr:MULTISPECIES: pyridoxamine 5'-phosphate oxidase family protein [Rhodomicrobium]
MSETAIPRYSKVRRADRGSYDHAAIHAVLDEGLVAHVGFVADDRPMVIPMIYGRVGENFYLHGAKAARFAKTMGPGVPVCITLTLPDAIVVGRSAFHCSMNYRAVMIHGNARLVTDLEEAEAALAAVTDHLLPGRWAESRPMTEKELRSTAVLRVEVEAASLKARSGPPIDEEEDYELPIWAGLIPLRVAAGAPVGDSRLREGVAIPASVKARL